MANPNPNWRDNFLKKVTVQCYNCGTDIIARKCDANRDYGLYCEECKPERRRELGRNNDHKRNIRRKEQRRKEQRRKAKMNNGT